MNSLHQSGRNFEPRNITWYINNLMIIALGVGLASYIVPGINYDSWKTLVIVVVLFSIIHTIVKPILILFTLPFIILTLGIGVWLINGFLFIIVSKLVSGFVVESYGGALWGAFIVSLVSAPANTFMNKTKSNGYGLRPRKDKRVSRAHDDVIDV